MFFLRSLNEAVYGEFPDIANDYSNKSMLLPSGVIIGGNLKEVQDVDLKELYEWAPKMEAQAARARLALTALPRDCLNLSPASCRATSV